MKNTKQRSILAIAMAIKDDVEAIDLNIRHHLRMGFDLIYVMDFGSTDGTGEVLKGWEGHPKVVLFSLPNAPPDNRHLQQAFRLKLYENPAIDFIIHLDPDEFLMIEEGLDIHDVFTVDGPDAHLLHRRNVVPMEIMTRGISEDLLGILHKLFLFNNERQTTIPTVTTSLLHWLSGTPMPKVCHRTKPVRLGMGFHVVSGPELKRHSHPGKVGVAHLPLTSFKRFEYKLRNIRDSLSHAPHLYPKGVATHWKLFYQAQKQGVHRQLFDSVIHDSERIIRGINKGEIVPSKILYCRDDEAIMPVLIPRDTSYPLQSPGDQPIM